MTKLPIGIQSFSRLIDKGCAYVDKTEYIYSLVTSGTNYFFSRPRRFGKSLLLSTLEAVFRGERDLFRGTWIDRSDYSWTSFPVLRLDFSELASDAPESLNISLVEHFEGLAEAMEVPFKVRTSPAANLASLVRALAKQGPVVLLIDEYDDPLTSHIQNDDLVKENREVLSRLFKAIKSLGSILEFVFITGVSRFSKVSLFSGMNNLEDISLSPSYGTLVGFTEKEIVDTFADSISSVAQGRGKTTGEVIDEMRLWYNGYSFNPLAIDDRVFNPWSVLNYLDSGRRKNYWFDSGAPTFAIKLIEKNNFPVPELETGVKIGNEIEISSDVDQMPLEVLLFQTGYLTIDSFDENQERYSLRFPNEEVCRSLINHLFLFFTKKSEREAREMLGAHLQSLEEEDFELFFTLVNVLLAEIPYPAHIKQERYYQTITYLFIRRLGLDANGEVTTHRGRADFVVRTKSAIILFEFKLDKSAQKALDQIRKQGYAERYRAMGRVILVGANINSDSRSCNEWKKELL